MNVHTFVDMEAVYYDFADNLFEQRKTVDCTSLAVNGSVQDNKTNN